MHVVAVVTQVLHKGLQVLHTLPEESPYSLLFSHVVAQVLVPLFPKVGEGHVATQVDELK